MEFGTKRGSQEYRGQGLAVEICLARTRLDHASSLVVSGSVDRGNFSHTRGIVRGVCLQLRRGTESIEVSIQ